MYFFVFQNVVVDFGVVPVVACYFKYIAPNVCWISMSFTDDIIPNNSFSMTELHSLFYFIFNLHTKESYYYC